MKMKWLNFRLGIRQGLPFGPSAYYVDSSAEAMDELLKPDENAPEAPVALSKWQRALVSFGVSVGPVYIFMYGSGMLRS